jgi:hypothetical protein
VDEPQRSERSPDRIRYRKGILSICCNLSGCRSRGRASPAFRTADARRQEVKRLENFGSGSVDIVKDQHVFEAVFPPTFVTTASFESFWILKCAEKNVPQRNVGKIIGMMSELMMNTVRFRTLKNISQPFEVC